MNVRLPASYYQHVRLEYPVKCISNFFYQRMEHPNQVTHKTSKQLSLVDGEADDAGKLEEEAIHTNPRACK
jgi:hypothetical protein